MIVNADSHNNYTVANLFILISIQKLIFVLFINPSYNIDRSNEIVCLFWFNLY